MNEEQPVNTPNEADFSADSNGFAPINTPVSTVSIPVIEESLTITKEIVETGRVRLVKTVQQDEQLVSIPLSSEQIEIERVACDQLVDAVPEPRQEGDTTIYPVLKEEYIIQKRLRLVEEIRVTRRQVQTVEQQPVVLRRERIEVERVDLPRNPERSDSINESSL